MLPNSKGDAHFRVSAEGVVIDYHASGNMAGIRKAADVVGRHVRDLAPPGTAAAILAAIEACVTSNSVVEIHYMSTTDDGQRAREARFTPIGNSEVLGIMSDITERLDAESRQKHSEERFRALVAESSDVIVILDEQAQIKYASPTFTRLLGYPEGTLVGTSGFDIIHPDDLEAAANAFLAAHTGENSPSGLQYRVRHCDGSWRWTESRTTNHLDTPGVNGYIVNARDITARHEANEKVQQTSDLLTSVMGAASTEAIFVTDISGTIVAFSLGAEVLLGYSAGEVLGKVNPIVFHLREDLERIAAELGLTPEAMMTAGPADGQPTVHEMVFVRRDGSRFDGLLDINGRLDSNGVRCGYVAVVRDITEQRRRQAELTHQAHFDLLTGLANRAYLQIALAEAADDPSWSDPGRTMLFIDLDHFKQVNDTLGHAAGDAVLIEVATRLVEKLRGIDLPARIGGDEFVVLLGPNVPLTVASDVAERIVEALATPFMIVGTTVTIGASVGMATSDADTTPEELLRVADIAVYSAKHAGRGRVFTAVR
ncbi:MAG: PAS domain S-box protein [Ilumatobacteraceae bacterium]